MIAQIRGQLVEKRPGVVIVETQGIGYQVFVSLSTFYDLPEATQGVRLHTYTHVREDLLQLFGFSTFLEKEIFQILIGVSGIGPKLALNILSGIAPAELIASLQSEDVARLTQIPGVGRKTAERLVFDLKEKIGKIAVRGETPKEEKRKKGPGSGRRGLGFGESGISEKPGGVRGGTGLAAAAGRLSGGDFEGEPAGVGGGMTE